MFDGNRFLPETGIPILKIARKMVLLAVELPEPFLVPTIMEKSFTTLFMILLNVSVCMSLRGALVPGTAHRGRCATKQSHIKRLLFSKSFLCFIADCFAPLAMTYFTVFDTTGRYGRSAPHVQPCNLHCKSLPPYFHGSAILPSNTHSLPQRHSDQQSHRHPSRLRGCRSRMDFRGGYKLISEIYDVLRGGLGSVFDPVFQPSVGLIIAVPAYP